MVKKETLRSVPAVHKFFNGFVADLLKIIPRVPPRQLLEICQIFLTLLTTIPPPFSEQRRRIRELTPYVLPALILLASMQVPFDDYLTPIIQSYRGFGFRGRDVFVIFENQRYLFWLNTGELPETLVETFRISGNFVRLNKKGEEKAKNKRVQTELC